MRVRRRALIISGVALGTLSLLAAIGWWVVYPRAGKWQVESKVIPKLEAKLGRDVEVGKIDVDHGHAVLRDVEVHGELDGDEPLVTIDRVDIDFGTWASLMGRAEVGAVTLDGVHVRPRRDADGRDNFRDILTRLGLGDGAATGAETHTGFGSMKPTKISLVHGEVKYVDEAGKVTAAIESFEAEWLRGGRAVLKATGARADTSFGPAAAATSLIAIDDPIQGRELQVAGGSVTLWPKLSLTGIEGAIAPAADGKFSIDLAGGYGGVEGRLWTAAGVIDPAGSAVIDLDAERFTLDRLRPIIERSAMLDYERATVDARLHIEASARAASFSGGFHLRDFTISHPMLAEKPVTGLEVGGEVTGRFDRDSRTLVLERADVSARGLPFALTGWLAMPGGLQPAGTRRAMPAMDVRLTIPSKPCQEVLDAIPPELVPYLQGFKLTGNFDTDVRLAIDWTKLDDTVLAGHVGLYSCRGKRAPEEVARLRGTFEHYVEVERGEWLTFIVGPENPDFVPIENVSQNLINSLMTTEDSAFYRHRGFIPSQFRTALVKNLKAGYFKYGASSITMQMVKNVLLYREKTASRKLQELFLTWYIETALEKDRILEIYVNVIEYGPGLYGIGPAARHYFGKEPSELSPVEAAFFSSILPNPKERYAQYCKGTLRQWTADKIARILSLMLKRGRLTQDEYDLAIVTPLVFVKDGSETEEQCMQRRRHALRNARPTNPLKK
jgi:hypothetical protein